MRIRVHPAVSHVQAMLASLEKRTGKPLEDWCAIARSLGESDVNRAAAKLKDGHGLGKPTAWMIADYALGDNLAEYEDAAYLAAAPAKIDAQYAGKKAALRPLADRLFALIDSIGPDVAAAPAKTMVPFYRHRVFAQVKAATQKRLDVGLALGRYSGALAACLKDTGGAEKGDRITHVYGVEGPEDIGPELTHWLKQAYELDE
ncbi:MAG: DUF4287 domain-containing protein [Alphaproteobacteria bacterium]|nr:MAG: DUF4287 domain-containing protein [Alphaproteobacteria bacterium]